MVETHFRTCNLCEAMCGIAITHENGEILSIKGDPDDPFSQGHICPKAVALQDLYTDPNRLKHPVKKTENGWEQISWDEAFTLVGDNIKRIQAEHGANSAGIYLGNPNVHNLGAMLFGATLFKGVRTQNRFSATSADQLPHHVASLLMLGHYFLLPVPDVDRTDYFLILGANPLVSNGSIMTAGGIEPRMKGIQARGGKIVVVDPRKTKTAQMADEHLFIQPGDDVYLLLALVNEVLAQGADLGRLETAVLGLEDVVEAVKPYSAEIVADIINIPAETIRRIATEFREAESAVAYGRMGVSVQEYGGLCQWLIYVLNIITGNFDEAGGAMFASPAFDIVTEKRAGQHGRWHSRVKGLPEWLGELPVSTMLDEMTTEGEGQIRAMVTGAGNPVLSMPNGSALDSVFADLEFMVSIDVYVNETTRHADVILPPAMGLEVDHFDVVFNHLAVRNTVKFSPALFEPEEGMKHDYEILQGLGRALATEEHPFNEQDPRNVATPEMLLDFGLKMGEYKLGLEELKENPHGIDLGPLKPVLPERLFTPDKMIQLAPREMIDDLERVEAETERRLRDGTETDGFSLISRRELRSNNSWMHNSERLMKGKNRCVAEVNATTSQALGFQKGDMVKITSRTGSVTLPIEPTNNIAEGVISIPHGYGHNKSETQLTVANAHAGVSVNDLTDNDLIDPLTGNAAFSGVRVTLEKVEKE